MTFDVLADQYVYTEHGWQDHYESFSVCRHCHRSTTFILAIKQPSFADAVAKGGPSKLTRTANDLLTVEDYLSLKDEAAEAPPDHVPIEIKAVFSEGATCMAVGCYNAAGTMFRLCLDLASSPLLPPEDIEGLNRNTRRSLGLRLPWLFDHGKLPESLRELSSCVKEDGNDGAHAGTLTKIDAQDLVDFTRALLDRLYTEPEKLRLAKERRDQRRQPPGTP